MGSKSADKSAKLKERELIVKLSHDGKTCREIASLLGVSKSKSSYWILRYTKTKDLKDKPRSGRPTQLTNEKLRKISEKIKAALQKQTYMAGISSKEVTEILVNETGKRYTLRHTRRLLHTMGFSLVSPRVHYMKRKTKVNSSFRDDFKKSFKGTKWNTRS
jgi:transposase